MNRTQALCEAFGWQGGTIHQIAAETGCDVEDLLYSKCDQTFGYCQGWIASNALEFSRVQCFRNFKGKGNLDFWFGVAEGIQHKNGGCSES